MEGLSEHEQLFYNDGYQLGLQAAKNNYQEKDLFAAMQQMYEGIDQLNDSLSVMASKQNMPVHCRKGCNYCCHQAVFANSYELHYLGNFILKNFNSEEIDQVRKQASAKDKITSQLSETDMLQYKGACPLLQNGVCSVYQARPMACRIYLSTNVSSCLEFFKHPENEANYPALLDFPLMAGRMMNEGFMAALKENEIEFAEFRLEEGLNNLLNS